MKIEIYRKRPVFNFFTVDEVPDVVIENVTAVNLGTKAITYTVNGENKVLRRDDYNRFYTVKE